MCSFSTRNRPYQSLLIISPVTRRAATWPLVLELKFFLSNNVRMSTATAMCLRDHNSNNCTHSGNVCCCTYMVNNDYDKIRSFYRLYMTEFISASNWQIFAWKSRQIFGFSLQWPAGAGFMNRRRLCQLTAAILTSDLTTHMRVL